MRGLENLLDAIRHVFASLYNDRAISYRVHQGLRARATSRCRPACSAWCAATSRASGVMFTLDTESGFDQVVFITSAYGLGETVVQGQVNPDEFYVYKRGARRPGKPGDPAPRPRLQGGEDDLTAKPRRPAARCRRSTCPKPSAAVFDHRRGGRGARALRGDHREALRPPDGHRMGQGRHRRQALRAAGAAGDGEGAARRSTRCAATASSSAPKCSRPGARSASASAAARCGWCKDAAEMDRVQRRRRAGHRHDRPRLGAGDEARRGDRHQPRRAHLPRGDHRARAGHSRGRRLRRRDAAC